MLPAGTKLITGVWHCVAPKPDFDPTTLQTWLQPTLPCSPPQWPFAAYPADARVTALEKVLGWFNKEKLFKKTMGAHGLPILETFALLYRPLRSGAERLRRRYNWYQIDGTEIMPFPRRRLDRGTGALQKTRSRLGENI